MTKLVSFYASVAIAICTLTACSINSSSTTNLEPTQTNSLSVEELRLTKLVSEKPQLSLVFKQNLADFEQAITQAKSFSELNAVVAKHANLLWQVATTKLQAKNSTYDDRPLYWARLQFSKMLKTSRYAITLTPEQLDLLYWTMERASRGQKDINFSNDEVKKVLVTGFDPFFLDRNIAQSNPSGLAALLLDGKVITTRKGKVQIESAIFPVRFIDFDLGEVENFLMPFYQSNSVDMIATISMGREHFDLERFPGLRRSAKAPDNLNVFTGASSQNPIIPLFKNQPLSGPEFVEFSLPVAAMQQALGRYQVNDNNEVTTLEKNFHPKVYADLTGSTSVAGSGGGYLSNEISYRSINLRNKLGSQIPTGHIHTPRIQGFEPQVEKQIVQQIEAMLVKGINSLK